MATVRLIPMGNKIKWQVRGKVLCNRIKGDPTLLQNSMTVPFQWRHWVDIFGSKRKAKAFMKANRTVRMSIPLSALGYDKCDHVI